MDPAHGELEPRPAGPGLGLALHLAALATSRHLAEVWKSLEKLQNAVLHLKVKDRLN